MFYPIESRHDSELVVRVMAKRLSQVSYISRKSFYVSAKRNESLSYGLVYLLNHSCEFGVFGEVSGRFSLDGSQFVRVCFAIVVHVIVFRPPLAQK